MISRRNQEYVVWVAILVASIMTVIFAHAWLWVRVLAGVVGIVAFYEIAWEVRAYDKARSTKWRTKKAEGELDGHIETALMKMESIGGYYADEDSANQQLCLLLRELAPGADVQLVKPGSGGKGDIKVGNTIIEGKLDLVTKDELDRLIGQLQDYCDNSASPIRVVVYGKLRPDFRRRIEGLHAYYERILLHHVEGIRTRRPTVERYTVVRHERSGEGEETEYEETD